MSYEEKRYFWQTPNMIDDINLSLHAWRLLGHFLRICGDNKKCTQGTRLLAKWCSMGHDKVVSSKRELVAAGLIRISKITTPSGPGDQVEIVKDIWNYGALVYRDELKQLDKLPDSPLKNTALRARSRNRQLRPKLMNTIPTDFCITTEMREWAENEVPDVDIDRETDRIIKIFEVVETNTRNWKEFWKKWMRDNAVCKYEEY